MALLSVMSLEQRLAVYTMLGSDPEVQSALWNGVGSGDGSTGTGGRQENTPAESAAYDGGSNARILPPCDQPCERRRCAHGGRSLCNFHVGHTRHEHTCSDCNDRYQRERLA